MEARRSLKNLLALSFFRGMFVIVILMVLPIMIVPFIQYLTDQNKWANALRLLLFQPLVIDQVRYFFSSSLILIIWIILFYFRQKYIKIRIDLKKDKLISIIIEALTISGFMAIVEYSLVQEFSWFISLFIFIIVLYTFLEMLTITSCVQSWIIGPGIVILLCLIFAVIFGLMTSLIFNGMYWLIIPNMMSYILIIAFGGVIGLQFVDVEILLNLFYLSPDNMFYSYIQGVFPYITIISILGFSLLLVISSNFNRENKLKEQLVLTSFFSLIMILNSQISKIGFYFLFIGDIQVRGLALNSVMRIWIYMMSIYLGRQFLNIIFRRKSDGE